MYEARQTALMVHALDLDATAAGDRDVDVLARSTRPAAHASDGARGSRHQTRTGLDFPRRSQVGLGDDLGERHPEPVGAKRDAVADVRDLAAGILLQRQLSNAQHLVDTQLGNAKRHGAVQAHHDRALKACRDRTIEVLLAHDVELGNQIEVEHQAQVQRHAHGFLIELERWPCHPSRRCRRCRARGGRRSPCGS